MLDAAFAIPGDLNAATGGYGYGRQVLALLPEFGVNGHRLALPGSFPSPTDDDLTLTRRLLEQLHPTTPILFDGLAYGALPPRILADLRSPIIALVHHPLAYETGLEPEQKDRFMTSERVALSRAEAVIVSSPLTAHVLVQEFNVPPEKLTIAEPGTEPAMRATGTGSPFTMLAVGSLIPRKGYTVLIDALRELSGQDWHLIIAGSPDYDPAEANRLREAVLASGKRGQITIAGKVSDKALVRHFTNTDLFVMPSLYEGYGMVLAEALAHGLAIVCTTGGAAADTAPDAAAVKVAPGDAPALSAAIDAVMRNDPRRTAMSDAAWAAGRNLPRWPTSVKRIADVIKAVHKEQTS